MPKKPPSAAPRAFCWTCHRPTVSCFCALVRPFKSSASFILVVHPDEVSSTVGTAWILRSSMPGLKWIRSAGDDLDQNPQFLGWLENEEVTPLLLFPGQDSINLNLASEAEWLKQLGPARRPVFVVLDGTWNQAKAMLKKSRVLQSLQKASFEATTLSEYQFKRQPHPACLSSVEGVHRVIEVLGTRGWSAPPPHREHDQMLAIFRGMVEFQLNCEARSTKPSNDSSEPSAFPPRS